MSGALEGSLSPDGQFVENVQDVTMSFNGTPVSGYIWQQMAALGGPDPYIYGTVVMSFDVMKCNFMFSDGGDPANYWGGQGYTHLNVFKIAAGLPEIIRGDGWYYYPARNAYYHAADGPSTWDLTPVPARWSLTAVPVPEPTTYLAGLSLLGMLGWSGWRNRK